MRGTQALRASPRMSALEAIREAELRELGEHVSPLEDDPVVATERPALRLAPPPPVKVVRTPFVILVIVVVVAGVMGILMLNTRINQNAFRLAALREEQTKLDLRQQQLEQQIAQYESPGNLAAAAAKLGLVEPGSPAFIVLPDGKVIGVPRPATETPSITSQ